MIFFVSAVFFLIGILSGIYSPFLLFLNAVPLSVLLLKRKKRDCILLSFALLGFLISYFYPKGSEGLTEVKGICVYRRDSYYLLLTIKGKYMVYDKDNLVSLFSVVSLKGQSEPALFSHYESGFDFQDYLRSHGVFHLFTAKETTVCFASYYKPKVYKEWIYRYLTDDNALIVGSLLFGDSFASLEEANALTELGLSSAIALSGFHISFFFKAIAFLLGQKKEKYLDWIELVFLSLFLIASGFRYSIRRLFLLTLLKIISERKKLSLSYLDRISITMMILLLFEPYSILSGGFYYPFPLLFFLAVFPFRSKHKLSFFLQITAFFFPLRLFSQYSFCIISPLLQLVLIPYSHLLFLCSLLLFIIPPIGYLLNPLISLFLETASFSSKIGFSFISGKPVLILVILYYLSLCLYGLFQIYGVKKRKRDCGILLATIALTFFTPDYLPHQEVTFIDVNQGDATLIRYGQSNILIDTGGNVKEDYAINCLIPYFHKRRIRQLDAVLITHTDYDHYGCLASLKEHFPVQEVLYREDFLKQDQNLINIQGLDIKNLNTYDDKSDSNSQSAVFQFTIADKRFLIMGDAPFSIEERLIQDKVDVSCDILKVGHHGSSTSSSYVFLKETAPKVAVISCGYKNKYGHPNQETIQRLDSLHIPYRRTDMEGSISFSFPMIKLPFRLSNG